MMNWYSVKRLVPKFQQAVETKLQQLTSRHWASLYGLKNRATIEVVLDHAVECLVLQLKSQVIANQHEHIYVNESYPQTWWDHFKQRWYPEWLLNYFPAQLKRIYIDRTIPTRVCPHLNVPDVGPHVDFLERRISLDEREESQAVA